MGSFLSVASSGIRSLFSETEYKILVVGLEGSGKTSLVRVLSEEAKERERDALDEYSDSGGEDGTREEDVNRSSSSTTKIRRRIHTLGMRGSDPESDPSTISTIGANICSVDMDDVSTLQIFDLPGESRLRAGWYLYFEGTQGIVFVIDTCKATFEHSIDFVREEMFRILTHEDLRGIPLLILLNPHLCSNQEEQSDDAMFVPTKKVIDEILHIPRRCCTRPWRAVRVSSRDGIELNSLWSAFSWLANSCVHGREVLQQLQQQQQEQQSLLQQITGDAREDENPSMHSEHENTTPKNSSLGSESCISSIASSDAVSGSSSNTAPKCLPVSDTRKNLVDYLSDWNQFLLQFHRDASFVANEIAGWSLIYPTHRIPYFLRSFPFGDTIYISLRKKGDLIQCLSYRQFGGLDRLRLCLSPDFNTSLVCGLRKYSAFERVIDDNVIQIHADIVPDYYSRSTRVLNFLFHAQSSNSVSSKNANFDSSCLLRILSDLISSLKCSQSVYSASFSSCEHPLTGSPCVCIHPCQVEELISCLNHLSNIEDSGPSIDLYSFLRTLVSFCGVWAPQENDLLSDRLHQISSKTD